MQIKTHYEDGKYFECNIPDEDIEVMPGVPWGNVSQPFTPAFWRLACIANGAISDTARYHLGTSLKEEVIACLLGGHGVKGELGLAAFDYLCKKNIVNEYYSVEDIELMLREPLDIDGRFIKYRYPRQKAKYIFVALQYLNSNTPPLEGGKKLRDWLTAIPGIGYKTASWIARNWLDATDIAILDIHIHRAGVIAGIFLPNDNVAKDYLRMENNFVQLANGIGIPANVLDNQIWNELRTAPATVRKMLEEKSVASVDRCGLPASHNSSTNRNYKLFASVQ